VRPQHHHAVEETQREQPDMEVARDEYNEEREQCQARDPAPERQPLRSGTDDVQAAQELATQLRASRDEQPAVADEAVCRRLHRASTALQTPATAACGTAKWQSACLRRASCAIRPNLREPPVHRRGRRRRTGSGERAGGQNANSAAAKCEGLSPAMRRATPGRGLSDHAARKVIARGTSVCSAGARCVHSRCITGLPLAACNP
jgi:hypothetical protein